MGQRILAVDDNPVMRDIYMHVLGAAGYEVLMASNGSEALKVLEAEDPDLVLLDIEMPIMSGWQLLEIMRARMEWEDIPVLLVTALLEPSALELASTPRYDCYLTKKTTGKDLLQLVEHVLACNGTALAAPESEANRPERPAATEDAESGACEDDREPGSVEKSAGLIWSFALEETDSEMDGRLEALRIRCQEGPTEACSASEADQTEPPEAETAGTHCAQDPK